MPSPDRSCGRPRGTAWSAPRSRGWPRSRPGVRASLRPSRHDPAAMRPAKLLFWASSALIVHTHAGYPALLWLLARARGQGEEVAAGGETDVSVVVAAYDEEDVIAHKVENVLALD